jgi:hypothetical protein
VRPRIKPTTPPLPAVGKRLFRFRPRVWAGLALVFGVGIAAHFVWQRSAPNIAARAQYLITADHIHITPPPSWIRHDIKAEALRDLGLGQSLSVLDDWPSLAQRVESAFEFHPWVASVDRISKGLPSSLMVELTYRRPIAAVESSDSGGVAFLPIDEHAIRLPEGDLTDAECRHLPRISGIAGRPLVGDPWNDPRVEGGAKLATALADVWQRLQLIEILPDRDSPSNDHTAHIAFEIVTTGGTRILWGAAPGLEASVGESPIDLKRERLLQFSTKQGGLDSIDGPARLDVRRDLIVTPRTARSKDQKRSAEATQTK